MNETRVCDKFGRSRTISNLQQDSNVARKHDCEAEFANYNTNDSKMSIEVHKHCAVLQAILFRIKISPSFMPCQPF